MKILFKILCSIVILMLWWESSNLVSWMADMPSDLAVIGAAVSLFVFTAGMMVSMYKIWKEQIEKGLSKWLEL